MRNRRHGFLFGVVELLNGCDLESLERSVAVKRLEPPFGNRLSLNV